MFKIKNLDDKDIDTQVQQQIAEDFWIRKMENVKTQPIFIRNLKPVRGQSPSHQYGEYHLPLSGALKSIVHSASKGIETNSYLIFLMALNILIHKYSGSRDIVIGTTPYQSDGPEPESPVLLYFRTKIDSTDKLRRLLNRGLNELNCDYQYRQFDFEEFLERFRINNIGDEDALFSFGLEYNQFNGISPLLRRIYLLFSIRHEGTGVSLYIRYDKNRYRLHQVRQLGRHFFNILKIMLEDLDQFVSKIAVITADEKQQLLHEFNKTTTAFPQHIPFCRHFTLEVAKFPFSTAIVYEENTLTYGFLDKKAGQLAHFLLKSVSLQEGDLAAVIMDRSDAMIQSILAVWKCGGAYVPIESEYPRERIRTILNETRAKVLLIDQGLISPKLEKELTPLTRIIYVGQCRHLFLEEKDSYPDVYVPSSALVYIIFTSGSTGIPKGVMIEQKGMLNHLYAKIATLGINKRSVVAQNASHCFDISVWQFFVALMKGGRTVIYSNLLVLSPLELIKKVDAHGVTILEVVPSYLNMMLELIREFSLSRLFSTLNHLLVTGETVKPALVKQWFESFPGISMVNAYGPTEASDDITHYIMDRFQETESIPIGKTLQNFHIYIVDEHSQLCPTGVGGEICVSGVGVGRGYLNDVEKTNCAFVQNPFREEPYMRMYKTGDLGRYLWDGCIEFMGRKDHQLKIRGYRIEPGEVENKLFELEGVKDAVVKDFEDSQENKYLCAYITLKKDVDRELASIEKELKDVLPTYMVPAQIVLMQSLPLTPNGKVNRKALPVPGDKAWTKEAIYKAPRNTMEKKLVKIWEDVLGIKKIGIRDNFFHLGGDSLKGIRIVNRIQEWLNEVVHVTVIFLAPTIEKMAFKLESYKKDINSQIDQTSVDEMRRLIPALEPYPGAIQEKNPPMTFILSPPRSGSTLLRVILAGHPGLFAPQEMELMSFNVLQERRAFLDGKFSFYLEGVIRAVMEIKGCEAEGAKDMMDTFEAQGMTCKEFYGVLQKWLGDRMMVEKTPAYTLDMEILKRMEAYFENTLYIHLIRNPYAGIYSFEGAKLDQLFKYENNFSPRQLAELVWLISHQNIIEFLATIPRKRKLTIKYEDLVKNPGPVVQSICNHLGVTFHKDMLQVYSNLDRKMTNGIYQESKMLGDVKFFSHKTISSKSIDKWRKEYKTEFLCDMTKELAKSFEYCDEIRIMEREEKEVHAQENLVLLKRGTRANMNLFFIHDGTGKVDGYAELCKNLTSDYNCQGIVESQFQSIAPQERTIEEIAANYIGLMKTCQQHGPYVIAGWSLGGTIAFEMVSQLEKMEEKVTSLTMFDVLAPHPGLREPHMEFTLESELAWIKNFVSIEDIRKKCKKITGVDHLWQLITDILVSNLLEVPKIRKKLLEYISNDLFDDEFESLGTIELIRRFNKKRSNRKTLAQYKPAGKIKTPLYYFCADESEKSGNIQQWNKYCFQPVTSYRIDGNHLSIFKKPAVFQLAGLFEKNVIGRPTEVWENGNEYRFPVHRR